MRSSRIAPQLVRLFGGVAVSALLIGGVAAAPAHADAHGLKVAPAANAHGLRVSPSASAHGLKVTPAGAHGLRVSPSADAHGL